MYTDCEKLENLLEQIINFGHTKECMGCAPVYECGCQEKDQADLAKEALAIWENIKYSISL